MSRRNARATREAHSRGGMNGTRTGRIGGQAVSRCVQRRAFSDEAVLGVLRNEPIPGTHRRLDLSHRPELLDVGDGIRPAALYDQLLHTGEWEVVA